MTIKELRTITGLSQTEFARKYKLSLRQIQTWEQGQRNTPQFVLNTLEHLICEEERNAKIYNTKIAIDELNRIKSRLPYDKLKEIDGVEPLLSLKALYKMINDRIGILEKECLEMEKMNGKREQNW